MCFSRRFAGQVLALALFAAAPASADVIVNTIFDPVQLVIGANGAFTSFSGINLSVFAQALDSAGGFNQASDSNGMNAAANALTSFASGSGHAVLGTSPPLLVGGANSSVLLPNLFNGFASGEGQTTMSGGFEITGVTGPISVNFTAYLDDHQLLKTTGTGVSASSESIFTLTVPDAQTSPLLSFDNLLTIGPNQTVNYFPGTITLATSAVLMPNTIYPFVAALDSESFGASTPEPASIALLLTTVGLSGLLCRRARLRNGTELRP
jgi:hypothetical protein